MIYDYRILQLLRENTVLDPISYLKVEKERETANKNQQIINKVEHCCIGVDFTKAIKLETDLRFEAWKRKIFDVWNDGFNHIDLNEFALDYLEHQNNQKRLLKKF